MSEATKNATQNKNALNHLIFRNLKVHSISETSENCHHH